MNVFTFIITNIIFFSFLLILTILIFTDERFSFWRKLLFLFLNICLILISIYLEKLPYLIIKDLFWYSLILNGSFIFHVIILNRMFEYCWKKHYEYLGYIISRISFTLSLSFLLYILREYIEGFGTYKFFKEEEEEEKKTFKYKYAKFFVEYIINKKIFYYILKYILKYIRKYLYYFFNILEIIFIRFIFVFHNYSLIMLGKSNINFNKKYIFIFIIIFIIFLSLSIMLGIPRLYLIWISQGIFESYKILNHEYLDGNSRTEFKKLKFFDKIKEWVNSYINKKMPSLSNCYDHKYRELEKIYEKPYHKFFMFDLCKFLNDKYHDGEFWYIWSCEWDREGTPYETPLLCTLEYPIRKIYKFYPWENLAIGYYYAQNLVFKYDEESWNSPFDKKVRIEEGLKWCELINKKETFLLKLMPEIVTEKDFILDKLNKAILEESENLNLIYTEKT